ncbi:MAG: glycosyltransferase family 2 protein [Flavobacterium sp.]|nr:glycosyltransferase family 2 protein [Flavobacterium sp.]
MQKISVIIIAKNEVENIVSCIQSAKQISDDIIVVDTGSTDNTFALAVSAGAKVISIEWQGFGAGRNIAATLAKNNWIFALDADERITPLLAISIQQLALNAAYLYGCKRESFLVNKKIRFGEWGRDKVFRLYNRNETTWDLTQVHENIHHNHLTKTLIAGSLLHYTMQSIEEYEQKTILYAKLSADKYFTNGKHASILKKIFSPTFSFIQNYIFRLGMFDGKEGLIIAKTSAKYAWLKYRYLEQLYKRSTII